jgi:hypothetical protein
VITRINKTFERGIEDVVKSLKNEVVLDLTAEKPTLKGSKKTDAAAKELEDRQFEFEYRDELKRYNDRKEALAEALVKAYGVIWSDYMTKAMRQRIEEHPEFENKIDQKPVALLIAIKSAMHESVRAQYPYVSLTYQFTSVLNIKQRDDENLLDYTKRFKQLRDVLQSNVDTQILQSWIEQTEWYKKAPNTTEKKALKDGAFEAWMAYVFLQGSDPNKLGWAIWNKKILRTPWNGRSN